MIVAKKEVLYMIKQLKKLFPSIQIYHEQTDLQDNYEWYVTFDNEVIGICKKELTKKDKAILSAFLKRYNIIFPKQTKKEADWHQLIFQPNGQNSLEIEQDYRFVYFDIEQDEIDPTTFKDAIEQLFGKEMAILWENDCQGIIIEEHDKSEEPISYTQIINVLMSDLYVKINFYIGQFQDSTQHVKQYYNSIIKGAKIARNYSKMSVTTYLDIIPYILIDQTEDRMRREIANTVLKEFKNDDETLKMIETFIQCNLNISVTAKELYMHRNSLQYRLDKFIEKTNIDIRQFHEAMAVYLALLASKSL